MTYGGQIVRNDTSNHVPPIQQHDYPPPPDEIDVHDDDDDGYVPMADDDDEDPPSVEDPRIPTDFSMAVRMPQNFQVEESMLVEATLL